MTRGRLRVGVDATPLLGQQTGVGAYVRELLTALGERDDVAPRAAAFSLRGREGLRELPPGVRAVHRPVPARLLHRAWLRGDRPSAEAVLGRQDVVHGTNFVLPPPRRAAGVVTVHDLSYLRYPQLVNAASLAYRELVPRALDRAAAAITPSRAVADELAAEYPGVRAAIHPVALGVNPSWLRADTLARPSWAPGEYVVAVGTLEPRKGLDVLLDAYRLLLAEQDAPPLLVVGPSGWGPELDRRGLPHDRVVTTGYQDRATVQALVAHAQLLAFPSRYEGFGLPPLEALAAGTPVVASDLPVTREVLGEHARFTPVGDPGALAAALHEVLTSPPGPQRRADARQHAQAFTWARCAAETMTAYREAVRGSA